MKTEIAMSTPGRKKERADKRKLRLETAAWQAGAIGLLALAALVNLVMSARIASLETARREDAERYQAQLESAERTRDLAVEELAEMSLRDARERADRAEQAAAYEAVGKYRYIGECTITYYCPCAECCGKWADGLTATGLPAEPGIVAVDPDVIPLGSTVVIDGQKYLAADTGVTGRHVDICMADHAATAEAGVRTAEVWVAVE